MIIPCTLNTLKNTKNTFLAHLMRVNNLVTFSWHFITGSDPTQTVRPRSWFFDKFDWKCLSFEFDNSVHPKYCKKHINTFFGSSYACQQFSNVFRTFFYGVHLTQIVRPQSWFFAKFDWKCLNIEFDNSVHPKYC